MIRKHLIAGLFLTTSLSASLFADTSLIPDTVKQNIKERVDTGEHISIVVGMVKGDTSETFTYGHTTSDKTTSVSEQTIYSIGSITKVLTGVTLATLIDDKTLTLDEPFYKLLPPEAQPTSPQGQAVSLKQLATHTSGLPRLPTNLDNSNFHQPYASYSQKKLFDFIHQYSWSKPPYGFTYSNVAYGLLGQLFEAALRPPYSEIVATRVLEPLKMSQTMINIKEVPQHQLATGHFGHIPVESWAFASLEATGAYKSNLSDMMRFVRANLNPKTTSISSALLLAQAPHQAIDEGFNMGLAWHRFGPDDSVILFHNGETGGFHSFMALMPAKQLGVVVLTNSKRDLDDIGHHLINPKLPLRQVKKAIDVPQNLIDQYLGTFQLAPGFLLTISQQEKQVLAQATGEDAFPIFAETNDSFFYRAFEGSLSFIKNEQGQFNTLKFVTPNGILEGKRVN